MDPPGAVDRTTDQECCLDRALVGKHGGLILWSTVLPAHSLDFRRGNTVRSLSLRPPRVYLEESFIPAGGENDGNQDQTDDRHDLSYRPDEPGERDIHLRDVREGGKTAHGES